MELFQVHSIEDAYSVMKSKFASIQALVEEVDFYQARNRICSEDVISTINVPHFNRSTVDGYAVISDDLYGASETMPMILELIGQIEMGHKNDEKIIRGQCMYVPTGGMLPEGADSVVMIEQTEIFSTDSIAMYKPTVNKENVLSIGDDVKQNQVILKRGQEILSKDIGVLAATGQEKIKVYRLPKVALLSTGDELVKDIKKLELGKILDINSYTISGLIESSGAKISSSEHITDEYDTLKKGVEIALKNADLVIVSGGSSMGEKDNTADIFNEVSQQNVFIHGLSIKPGKPTIVGLAGNQPLIGLPGQPVSAMIVYRVIVDWILKEFYFAKGLINKSSMAKLMRNVAASPGKTTYVMAKHETVDGEIVVMPIYGKSGMIQLIAKATGYIVIPSDVEGFEKDTMIEFHYFI